jgi:hypothetical protein
MQKPQLIRDCIVLFNQDLKLCSNCKLRLKDAAAYPAWKCGELMNHDVESHAPEKDMSKLLKLDQMEAIQAYLLL